MWCTVLDDPVEGDVFADYSSGKPSEDKACQIPETVQSRQSYECVGHRRKIDLRNEIMCKIDMVLSDYTALGVQGTQAIMRDILTTKKFKGQFADLFSSHQKSSSDDKLLNSLAKDYIAAKDKEKSMQIDTGTGCKNIQQTPYWGQHERE